MGFAKLSSAQPALLRATIVTIEADLAKGLHAFSVVGLPDKAIEESRDRVSAAIKNTGWKSPKQRNQKITIALAPADLKKSGPIYDLPIALCYLLATGDIDFDPKGRLFVGELSLDGGVRPVSGVLACAIAAKESGFSEIFVPRDNADEASLIEGLRVFPVESLAEVIAHLAREVPISNEEGIAPGIAMKRIAPHERKEVSERVPDSSFVDIRGQELAKRGLMIAAAGGHNVAMWGPPGTGKTMLAKAFSELLPPLSEQESIEVTSIHSTAGVGGGMIVARPPLRAPHHTSSYVSVIGGGTNPKPGEVTLAHRGVLFLDEFPEFDKRVIESLRQPLEEGVVNIARAKGTERFPSRFMLIAALNPCPCGYFGDKRRPCVCPPGAKERYQRRISGPIVDRIDLWIEVSRLPHETLAPRAQDPDAIEGFARTKARIEEARSAQARRFGKRMTNGEMSVKDIDRYVELDKNVRSLLEKSAKRIDLSPRAYHRVIKLARTIADLESSEAISEGHVLEALQYRPKRIFAEN